jgi:hypothetical protein
MLQFWFARRRHQRCRKLAGLRHVPVAALTQDYPISGLPKRGVLRGVLLLLQRKGCGFTSGILQRSVSSMEEAATFPLMADTVEKRLEAFRRSHHKGTRGCSPSNAQITNYIISSGTFSTPSTHSGLAARKDDAAQRRVVDSRNETLRNLGGQVTWPPGPCWPDAAAPDEEPCRSGVEPELVPQRTRKARRVPHAPEPDARRDLF